MGSDKPARVLLVDDDDQGRRALTRLMAASSFEVISVPSGAEALQMLAQGGIDVIVSDIAMPKMSGIELLRIVREHDPELPVILITGRPDIDSAVNAVELRAFRYLSKPVEWATLRSAIEAGLRARVLARVRDPASGREELAENLRDALSTLWMAYQPIVAADSRVTMGYEALLRTKSDVLRGPPAVLSAAEKLGTVHELGRLVRERIAQDISTAPREATFFVNLHSYDLADAALYDASTVFSRHARRIVLEVTERASLEAIPDVRDRIAALRDLNFRIAVDDLGAGYAGLTYFALLEPEIAKLDMSLVRGIDADKLKQRLVLSLTDLARSLGIEVVGEGVETAAERDCLVALGCTHLQGYGLARPGPPFPVASWEQ